MNSMVDHEPKWVPVDFTSAEIDINSSTGSKMLVIRGETPRSGGGLVKLAPATYVTKPDYWRIDVLWDAANAIFPSLEPFKVKQDLASVTGTKRVEVIGRTRKETIRV